MLSLLSPSPVGDQKLDLVHSNWSVIFKSTSLLLTGIYTQCDPVCVCVCVRACVRVRVCVCMCGVGVVCGSVLCGCSVW